MKLRWNERTTARTLSFMAVVAFGLILYFVLKDWDDSLEVLRNYLSIFDPFIIGFALAYLLNSPLRFCEEKIFAFVGKKRPRPGLRRALSIVLTLLFAAAALSFFFWVLIPQVVGSLEMLVRNIPGYIQSLTRLVQELAEQYNFDLHILENLLGTNVTTEGVLNTVAQYLRDALPYVYDYTMRIGGGIFNAVLGIIVSVYLMFSKEKLIAQLKKALYALMRKPAVDNLLRVGGESHRIFNGFIYGKIIDSLIIGILCFIGMTVFRMDYAVLISFVIGVTNVIPFFGPFIGAIPSILILLIVDPVQAVWFALFVLALQQFDGNILGPRILGDTTGLPALWVLFAILIGGDLFGVLGMFIGVPVFAVLYMLLREYLELRLQRKGMPTSTEEYIVESPPSAVLPKPGKKNKRKRPS